MSQTMANLQRQINVAQDLQTVVRTMKAIAASSIGQYEKSIESLAQYYRTVALGLGVCLREISPESLSSKDKKLGKVAVVILGSDQGLVGQFNDIVANHAIKMLKELPGDYHLWTIGERLHAHLTDAGLDLEGSFSLPNSVRVITHLVGQILLEIQALDSKSGLNELYLIFNYRTSKGYEPRTTRLLPLDKNWLRDMSKFHWPTSTLPEIMGDQAITLKGLIREYLFVSIFRACAQSLASENSSRLSAMQRADQNIKELLLDLNGIFHHLRQTTIDEELFDVVSGYEALSKDSVSKKSKSRLKEIIR